MQEAVAAILDVHKSDELMSLELVPPYYPLDEVCTSAAHLHPLFKFFARLLWAWHMVVVVCKEGAKQRGCMNIRFAIALVMHDV